MFSLLIDQTGGQFNVLINEVSSAIVHGIFVLFYEKLMAYWFRFFYSYKAIAP